MSRGLVHVSGSERRVLSHPGSPPSQTILEICIRRGGISIQCPAVWAVPGSPHLYTMHGCDFLPSAIDGNLHTQQPRRLAHSGPVAGGFNIAQDPSPLRLPGAKGHVLVCLDSWSMVSYINHQGGLVLKRLCMLANELLVWAQNSLRSLKATHVLGKLNHGSDMLSRKNVSSGEWTLHPLAVQEIWEVSGRAWVHLFASEDNSHCPIFFTKSTDALAHELPSLPLYAFPPIVLLPQVLRRVREQWHKLILIAPLWRNQPWVSELFQLLEAAPWSIPLRRDMMAYARGPSTQRLYALKLSIFSTWCQDRDLDPVISDVSEVLSFLQEMLDKQRSSSTVKVYAAAIAAFHAPIAGRSVGRDSGSVLTRR